jgi:uncharacterized membrane protein (DUF485 family)
MEENRASYASLSRARKAVVILLTSMLVAVAVLLLRNLGFDRNSVLQAAGAGLILGVVIALGLFLFSAALSNRRPPDRNR